MFGLEAIVDGAEEDGWREREVEKFLHVFSLDISSTAI